MLALSNVFISDSETFGFPICVALVPLLGWLATLRIEELGYEDKTPFKPGTKS
jgi:hypothetical protein